MAKSTPMPPKWMQKQEPDDDFFQTIALLENEYEIRRFMYAIVTKPERKMLSRRWRAVMLLYEGFDVTKIHQLTGIARGTISDLKKLVLEVTEADEVCRIFYERLRNLRTKRSV